MKYDPFSQRTHTTANSCPFCLISYHLFLLEFYFGNNKCFKICIGARFITLARQNLLSILPTPLKNASEPVVIKVKCSLKKTNQKKAKAAPLTK